MVHESCGLAKLPHSTFAGINGNPVGDGPRHTIGVSDWHFLGDDTRDLHRVLLAHPLANANLIGLDPLLFNHFASRHGHLAHLLLGDHAANLHWHLAWHVLGYLAACLDRNFAHAFFLHHFANLNGHLAHLLLRDHLTDLHRHLNGDLFRAVVHARDLLCNDVRPPDALDYLLRRRVAGGPSEPARTVLDRAGQRVAGLFRRR